MNILFFCQLMNSELAALQEKLEETEQRKEKIDQFLINSKGIYRQQVRLIKAMKSWRGFVTKCTPVMFFVSNFTSWLLTITPE